MLAVAVGVADDGIHWTDGRTVRRAASIRAFATALAETTVVLCEPDVYEGDRQALAYLRGMFSDLGHDLVPVSTSARAVLEATAGAAILGSGPARLLSLVTTASRPVDRHVAARQDW